MKLNIPSKSILILLIFYSIGIVQSCCRDNPIQNFQIVNTQLNNFDLSSFSETNVESILFESFALEFDITTEIVAKNFQSDIIFGTAYAQNCDDGIIPVLINQIQSASITADVDFNNSHPAGISLNELFEYRRVVNSCVENGGTIEDCGENQLELTSNENLTDILNNSYAEFSYFNMVDESDRFDFLSLALLNTEPQTNEPIIFTLDLVFENGQTESISTEPIILE